MLNKTKTSHNNHDDNNVPLESRANLEIIFRQALLQQNPNLDEDELKEQIEFLIERAENFETENAPEHDLSEVADKAHKIGLTCNKPVMRKANKKYSFSAQ